MNIKWPTRVQTMETHSMEVNVSHSAFMDDTIWICKDQQSAQRTIDISNQFFSMNDVKINGDKSELLVINSKVKKVEQSLNMGTPPTRVFAANKGEPIRFLGIWIRERRGFSHVKQMLMDIVKDFCAKLDKKKLTIAHLEFINNVVLLLTLNYRSQIVRISDTSCNAIHSKFMQVVKRKMGVRSTLENNILHHRHIVNVTPFRDQHKATHLANLSHKLNYKGISYDSTMLRARAAQLHSLNVRPIFNLSGNELSTIPKDNNLLVVQLQLAAEYGLSFPIVDVDMEQSFTIGGKGVLTKTILGEFISLFKEEDEIDIRKLMYNGFKCIADLQLFWIQSFIISEGNRSIEWQELNRARKGTGKRGQTPTWFKLIHRFVNEHFNNNPILGDEIRGKLGYNKDEWSELLIKPYTETLSANKTRKEWIVDMGQNHNIANNLRGSIDDNDVSSDVKIGKIIKKTEDSIEYQHWIYREGHEESADNRYNIEKCKGCKFDINGITVLKGIDKQRVRAIRVVKNMGNNSEACTIGQELWNRLRIDRILDRTILDTLPIPEISMLSLTKELILRYAKTSSDFIQHMMVIADSILSYSQLILEGDSLTFYSDGSLSGANEANDCRMGAGWFLENADISFAFKLVKWPSSTRAELFAIWSIVLLSPENSKITINTDSMAAIQGIEKGRSLKHINKWLSLNNWSIISGIIYLEKIKNIELLLVKVKAHSGIVSNDRADALAKSGAMDNDKTLEMQHATSCFGMQVAHWNNEVLDIPIRKFINIHNRLTHQASWALNSNVRKELVTNGQDYDINALWSSLKKYSGRNNRSFSHNRTHIFQVKLINRMLPTWANMKTMFPHVYPDNMCKLCNYQKETLNHLTVCTYFKESWIAIKSQLSEAISNWIKKEWDIDVHAQTIISLLNSGSTQMDDYDRNIVSWLMGLVPLAHLKILCKAVETSQKARKVATMITDRLQQIFRDDI